MRSEGDTFLWGVGIEGSSIPHLGISQFAWTGHDRRWRSDLRAIQEAFGPCSLRYPVAWERVQPRRGAFEWGETEERLCVAHELGLQLVAGLVHFGTPVWLPSAFGDPDFPQAVEEYAAAFAERLGGIAATYVPINEPLVTALFSGDVGLWPPHGRGWRAYMPVLSRIALGLVRATAAIRSARPAAEILYVEAVEHHRSSDPCLVEEIERRNHRRFLLLDLVSGRVDGAHPLCAWLLENGFPEYDLAWLRRNAQQPDRLGLDYYMHSETDVWLSEGLIKHRLPYARRGFAALAKEYHARYGWPILITETGASGSDETKSSWLYEMVREVVEARAAGVPVQGLFWWPAFDHMDWDGAMLHHSGNLHPVGLWRLIPDGRGSYQLAETPLVGAFAELVKRGQAAAGPLARVVPGEPTRRAAGAGPGARGADGSDSQGVPIVAHSHLRWSFVWQRPQQTHSRLAPGHPVLFLEEPLWIEPGEPVRIELSEPWPNVTVAQPMLPFALRERHENIEAAVLALLREALDGPLGRRFSGAVHWVYTPQMEGQLKAFAHPAAVVYDCMDELSQFAFAPPGLAERERRLLARADLVFTGGRQLYLAKSRLHPDVHFFGCGVDFEHFHRAASRIPVPADLSFIPGPRLGYIGVIDERLDYELLRDLMRDHPEWALVMVGPVVKVDPSTLPRPRNAFYLGHRNYETLPSYVAGFDVCLMPFALNAATEFINPTKTLEYLATGKPVVSTPVTDVVQNFGELVHIADRRTFGDAVRRVLAGERLASGPGLEAARRSSWERMVTEMERLVEEVIARRREGAREVAGATRARRRSP